MNYSPAEEHEKREKNRPVIGLKIQMCAYITSAQNEMLCGINRTYCVCVWARIFVLLHSVCAQLTHRHSVYYNMFPIMHAHARVYYMYLTRAHAHTHINK